MAAVIPARILGLRGQCVKQVTWDDARDALVFHCDRDRRFTAVDHRTGSRGTVNRRLRRGVQDLPVWGRAVVLSIAYCQLKIGAADRRMERLSFVEPGHGFTRRFARFVSQLARYMSIAAVARYTGLAWRTVKAMDARALERDLPALDPGALTDLRYLGVDEVARAKGHDYRAPRRRSNQRKVWLTLFGHEGESRTQPRETWSRLMDLQPCCTRDEGGPLGAAVQAEASNHPLLLHSKGGVVSELGKGRIEPVR